MTSDSFLTASKLSTSSKVSQNESSRIKSNAPDDGLETVALKGVASQESDVDSGIEACRKTSRRIGSTSSADTDSSQECRRKEEYSPPPTKDELSPSSLKVSGNLSSAFGPLKGDHSILKACSRRPPTPLTVFPEIHHCVRFDDQLQLSEQNIRRSCRKLFATLYAQRFSYPSSTCSPLEADGARSRSKTVPELDLRKHHAMSQTAKDFGEWNRGRNEYHRFDYANKENSTNRADEKKVVSWNLKQISSDLAEDHISSNFFRSRQTVNSRFSNDKTLRVIGRAAERQQGRVFTTFRTMSTDSGFSGCSQRCTCKNSCQICYNSSSHSSASSSSSSSSCRCCCNYDCCQIPTTNFYIDKKTGQLYKSNSCSLLSAELLRNKHLTPQTGTYTTRSEKNGNAESNVHPLTPLHKTSSCSNLCNSACNFQVTDVPVYNDNMIHAYARMASVVPENQEEQIILRNVSVPKHLSSQKLRKENIYDTIKASSEISSKTSSSLNSAFSQKSRGTSFELADHAKSDFRKTISNNDQNCSEGEKIKRDLISSLVKKTGNGESENRKSVEIQNHALGRPLPHCKNNYRSESNFYSSPDILRPKTTGVAYPISSSTSSTLKSALKQTSKVNSYHNVSQMSNANEAQQIIDSEKHVVEVEYAVVDKSKKSRYTSLPSLSRYESNFSVQNSEEKDHPPVPPKKKLHKSDFSLNRSRSSSPRKSTFLDRIQEFTRNAKDALQRALSTERIYRPEREERMEATGQRGGALRRSRSSFIKTLRASMSRKRKKARPPLAEVVPQASSDPVWDEHPSGPNSPTHVRGQLLQLNLDGSQVVELSKPPSKPYGFFVARGRVRHSKGVFVSRMRDQETQRHLAGLLDIGDEILEIDGADVKDADIIKVNSLMANKNTLLLTVLPYICRKDI